jgi:hypothetical protein
MNIWAKLAQEKLQVSSTPSFDLNECITHVHWRATQKCFSPWIAVNRFPPSALYNETCQCIFHSTAINHANLQFMKFNFSKIYIYDMKIIRELKLKLQVGFASLPHRVFSSQAHLARSPASFSIFDGFV